MFCNIFDLQEKNLLINTEKSYVLPSEHTLFHKPQNKIGKHRINYFRLIINYWPLCHPERFNIYHQSACAY